MSGDGEAVERTPQRSLTARRAPSEAEAADRAWRVIEAARAEAPAPERSRRLPRRLAIASAVTAAALAGGALLAGADVREDR